MFNVQTQHQSGLVLKWRATVEQPIAGEMLAALGRLLVPDQSGALHAFALADGQRRWQKPFEHAAVGGLALAGDLILVATYSTDLLRGQGQVWAFDVDGNDRWAWSSGGQRVSAPAVDGGRVYLTVDGKTLAVLDAASGSLLAHIPLPVTATPAAPLVQDGTAYIPCRGPHLLAINLEGSAGWRFDLEGDPNTWLDKTPALVGDGLFCVSTTGKAIALDAPTGALRWQTQVCTQGKSLTAPSTGDAPVTDGSPAIAGERLFVGARDGLHALSLDGQEIWHFPTGRKIEAAPALLDELVCAASHDHHLYILDAAAGTELARVELPHHIAVSPVVAGDLIVVADHAGNLAAVARVFAVEEYVQRGRWAEAACLYEQSLEWPQAVDCYQKAGDWARAGEIHRQLGDWVAAAAALARAARDLAQAAPEAAERRADLWAAAESCYVQVDDQAGAAECRRQTALCRRQPYIEAEIASPGRFVQGEYTLIELVLRNVGGSEAKRVIMHHTPSEFAGELSHSLEIRDLSPGSARSEHLSVRPLASGQVPLLVDIDYADADGRLYSLTYRTRVYVRRPGERATPPAAPAALDLAYADFELLVDRAGKDGYALHVHSPAGEADGTFRPPWTASAWAAMLGQLEANQAGEAQMCEWGAALFAALFQGQVGSRWRSSQGMAAQGKGLRLRLHVKADELIAMPWELLYDPERHEFPSQTRRTPVVRYLSVAQPAVAPSVSPDDHVPGLRMLIVAASPNNMPPLDVEKEIALLERAVQPLADQALLTLKVLRPPTVRQLREELVEERCDIVHFIGHGGLDARGGYLAMENEEGQAHRLGARQLKVLFSGLPVRLAVLNACLTACDVVCAEPGVSDRAYLGVAPALVDAGLLCVAAMQFSLCEQGAQVFAQDLYQMLARRKPVDEAIDQARVAMLLALGSDCRDWAAPVLFLRERSGELFPR